MKNKVFTEKEFNETDYCYEVNDEQLSDDIDDYFDELNSCIDKYTTQTDKEYLILDAKRIPIYEKDYIKIHSGRIEQYLEDYFEDNYSCSYCDFDVIEQTGIRPLIEEISKKIEESHCYYTAGDIVGYLDLSEQVKEFLKDEV